MLYILLCVPLYILNSFCDKYISIENKMSVNTIYNIIKFFIGTILLLPMFLMDSFRFEWGIIGCGILSGIMYAVSKMVILSGYEKTAVAFMTLCHSSGMLLPCVLGHFLWNEKLTLLSVVGIILVILSIMLLKGNPNLNEKRNIKGILIGIVVLVTSGGVMIVQKIMGIFFPQTGVDAYNFYSFACAFLLLTIFSKKGFLHCKISIKYVMCGFGSAVSLCVISLVMTYLASNIPSVIMFPLFNGSGIISVTLLSSILFNENITVKKGCGLIIGLIGLLMINI